MRRRLPLRLGILLPLLLASFGAAYAYDPVEEIDSPPPHRHAQPMAPQNALMVDCSGMHRGMFSSVSAAVRRARPGTRILVLPPGQGGGTCVESVFVDKPLTIASYGGGADAVIQAPIDQFCLNARIPLGDTLTIDGVRFIARNRTVPCLSIEAGRIAVRRSIIDSRSTDWAFDVRESAELIVSDSRIETDGSGIRADRARVELKNVDIDITFGRGGIGLDLQLVDGTVEGGTINGGDAAILASAGAHDLRIAGVTIRKAQVGVAVLAGTLGTVTLNRLAISRSPIGIAVEHGAEADISGNVITDAADAGIDITTEWRGRLPDNAHAQRPHRPLGPPPQADHVRIDNNTITVVPPAPCIRGRGPEGNACHPPPKKKRDCFFCWGS